MAGLGSGFGNARLSRDGGVRRSLPHKPPCLCLCLGFSGQGYLMCWKCFLAVFYGGSGVGFFSFQQGMNSGYWIIQWDGAENLWLVRGSWHTVCFTCIQQGSISHSPWQPKNSGVRGASPPKGNRSRMWQDQSFLPAMLLKSGEFVRAKWRLCQCRRGILEETWMYCGFLEADGGKRNERKDRDELWKGEESEGNKEAW